MLFSSDDRIIHESLLSKSRIRPDRLAQLGYALAAWAREGRQPTLEALSVSADMGPRMTSALLAVADDAGLLRYQDGVIEVFGDPGEIEANMKGLAVRFENLRTQDARRLDAVAGYARLDSCRAQHLREYFGEDAGEPCGICDRCRDRGDRPSSFFVPLGKKAFKKKRKRKRRRRRRKGKSKQPGTEKSPPSAEAAKT